MLLLLSVLSLAASSSLNDALRVFIDNAPVEQFDRVLKAHLFSLFDTNAEVRAEVEKYRQSTLYTTDAQLADEFVSSPYAESIRKMRMQPITPEALFATSPLHENAYVTGYFLKYIRTYTERFGLYDLPAAILRDFDTYFEEQWPLQLLTSFPPDSPIIPTRRGFTLSAVFRDPETIAPLSDTILTSTDGSYLYDLRQKCKVRMSARRILLLPSHKAASAVNDARTERILYFGRDGVFPLGTISELPLFGGPDDLVFVGDLGVSFFQISMNTKTMQRFDGYVPEMIQTQGRTIPLTVMTDRLQPSPITERMNANAGISVLGFREESKVRVVFDVKGALDRAQTAISVISFKADQFRASASLGPITALPGTTRFCQIVSRLCDRSANPQSSMAELIESISGLENVDEAGIVALMKGERRLPHSLYHAFVWRSIRFKRAL